MLLRLYLPSRIQALILSTVASDDISYVTGALLFMDCGMTAM